LRGLIAARSQRNILPEAEVAAGAYIAALSDMAEAGAKRRVCGFLPMLRHSPRILECLLEDLAAGLSGGVGLIDYLDALEALAESDPGIEPRRRRQDAERAVARFRDRVSTIPTGAATCSSRCD